MEFFEQLAEAFKANGLSETTITALSGILESGKATVTALQEQERTAQSKLLDAITTRDKAKQNLSIVKTTLGIEEITEEALRAKIENKDLDAKKIEEQLQLTISNLKLEHDKTIEALNTKVTTAQGELNNNILDMEILKIADSYQSVDGASKEVQRVLKDGAYLEDGKVKYRNSEGLVLRNKDGIEMSVSDRLKNVKEDMPFYFKSQTQETGANGNTPSGHAPNGNVSAFAQKMAEKAKTLR